MCMYACEREFSHKSSHMCVCVYIYVCIYVCVYVCETEISHVSSRMCVKVCMCVCVCVCGMHVYRAHEVSHMFVSWVRVMVCICTVHMYVSLCARVPCTWNPSHAETYVCHSMHVHRVHKPMSSVCVTVQQAMIKMSHDMYPWQYACVSLTCIMCIIHMYHAHIIHMYHSHEMSLTASNKCVTVRQVMVKMMGFLASGPLAFGVRLLLRTQQQRVTSGKSFFWFQQIAHQFIQCTERGPGGVGSFGGVPYQGHNVEMRRRLKQRELRACECDCCCCYYFVRSCLTGLLKVLFKYWLNVGYHWLPAIK